MPINYQDELRLQGWQRLKDSLHPPMRRGALEAVRGPDGVWYVPKLKRIIIEEYAYDG